MPADYKDKSCLVVAHGLFAELAVRLARDFGHTYLYVPWQDTYPTINKGLLGYGLEGIEKVDDVFGGHFEGVDLFVFPDLYHADLQLYLESLGKRVWGSRRGEELELYRGLCKEAMDKVGLPVHPWKSVRGMTALRAHLKAHDNQHVKLDKYRGMFETFKSEKYDLIAPKLDEIQSLMGPFAEELDFVVEDDLPDCVEVGLDCYTVDGEFPGATLAGIEVKDLGYVSQFKAWDRIPEQVRGWFETMEPYFKQYGYRGFLSNELRIGRDKVPYMIDCCARAACPPNELYQEFYTNLAQIVYEGAGGVLVDPEPAGKWGVEIILKSEWAEKHWQPVEIPEEVRSFVKLFNPVKVDGRYHVAPQEDELCEVGAVIGYGDTLEAALEMVDRVGEQVSGYGLKAEHGSLDTAVEQMQQLTEFGIPLFEV